MCFLVILTYNWPFCSSGIKCGTLSKAVKAHCFVLYCICWRPGSYNKRLVAVLSALLTFPWTTIFSLEMNHLGAGENCLNWQKTVENDLLLFLMQEGTLRGIFQLFSCYTFCMAVLQKSHFSSQADSTGQCWGWRRNLCVGTFWQKSFFIHFYWDYFQCF